MKQRGMRFDYAWRQALDAIVWPWNNESRSDWKAVIKSQRELWRSCYEDSGEPIDVDRLLNTLVYEHDYDDDPDQEHYAAA